ncbi:hypothetical protein B0H14DRAFT_2650728 [Mycena olivaceomarginata]|nr:hypothetical protein B0H14DRAFT_2650728 [Mycena olivaceomarginata]
MISRLRDSWCNNIPRLSEYQWANPTSIGLKILSNSSLGNSGIFSTAPGDGDLLGTGCECEWALEPTATSPAFPDERLPVDTRAVDHPIPEREAERLCLEMDGSGAPGPHEVAGMEEGNDAWTQSPDDVDEPHRSAPSRNLSGPKNGRRKSRSIASIAADHAEICELALDHLKKNLLTALPFQSPLDAAVLLFRGKLQPFQSPTQPFQIFPRARQAGTGNGCLQILSQKMGIWLREDALVPRDSCAAYLTIRMGTNQLETYSGCMENRTYFKGWDYLGTDCKNKNNRRSLHLLEPQWGSRRLNTNLGAKIAYGRKAIQHPRSGQLIRRWNVWVQI